MKTKIRLSVIFLLVIICTTFSSSFGQSTAIGNGRVAGRFLGWDNSGTSGTLEIKNDFSSQPINFSTSSNQRVAIDGNGNLDLTVTQGESYMINGFPVLWHNNCASNIFVGKGAGASINAGISPCVYGKSNTFVGYNAGNANPRSSLSVGKPTRWETRMQLF